MQLIHLVLVVAASIVWSAGAAQGPAPAAATPAVLQDGELCPSGRWYTDGGNACRNATSATPPLLHRPSVRWRHALSGTLVGEPLVWDDRVVVALRVNDKRRSLQVRRLGDGELVAERTINSTDEMWPSLWGNEVVSRVGSTGLELLRIGSRSVDSVERIPKAGHVGPPLRLGTSVFVVVDGHLLCLRAADFRVLWRSEAIGYVGAPSVLGGSVYALRTVGRDAWAVAEHDRSNGAQVQLGPAVALLPEPGDDARLLLGGGKLLVRFGGGSVLSEYVGAGGVHPDAMQLPLPFDGASAIQPDMVPLVPAIDARLRIAVFGPDGDRHLGLFRRGGKGGIQLDTTAAHGSLVDAPPTICGDVFYLGACAVDVDDLRVLWRLWRDGDRELPIRRAVPAGHMLLFGGDTELIAIGEAVPDDLVAHELRGVQTDSELSRLQQLVDDAVAAKDWALGQDLLSRCRDLQVDEAWATQREKDIGRARKKTRVRVDEARAEQVRSAAEAVDGEVLDQVQQLVASWAQDQGAASPYAAERVRRGLRFVLRQRPAQASATAMVRAMLPSGLDVPAAFNAADWLDFLDAAEQTRVEFLDASIDEFSESSMDSVTRQNKQQLLEWRDRWRQDLQALLSDRLLLLSPVSEPGSLAKALSTGELVCDVLESMFADLPPVREDPRPMLVFIYPDRDEFQAESKKAGIERVGWTAGYYSDQELVPKSRMFVPSDDVGFAGVLPTLAHELTHQWLMDRCPAFRPNKAQVMIGPRAYWIVEGFACLLEQFDFDLRQRRWQIGGGDLHHVDMVASAGPGQLLEWDVLVQLSRRDFAGLVAKPGPSVKIPSTMRLGSGYAADRLSMFYAQAAALCRYLYEAEGGCYRRQLLDFVVAYYRGDIGKLDFEQAFGVGPGELGPKVVEFARTHVQ